MASLSAQEASSPIGAAVYILQQLRGTQVSAKMSELKHSTSITSIGEEQEEDIHQSGVAVKKKRYTQVERERERKKSSPKNHLTIYLYGNIYLATADVLIMHNFSMNNADLSAPFSLHLEEKKKEKFHSFFLQVYIYIKFRRQVRRAIQNGCSSLFLRFQLYIVTRERPKDDNLKKKKKGEKIPC